MKNYLRHCGPRIIEKNLINLCGMLEGLLADKIINDEETIALNNWFKHNKNLFLKEPFKAIYSNYNKIIMDGKIEKEEIEDLLWLCRNLKRGGNIYNEITISFQFLHGLVAGIAADGRINEEEIKVLKKWCLDHEHLQGMWPFDEFYSLSLSTLEDGIITNEEKEIIIYYFKEFLNLNGNTILKLPLNEINKPITGVCAICPEITFEGKKFVITGESNQISRKNLSKLIEDCSGEVQKFVTKETNYLIILSEGNTAWAYKAYGRKVEHALNLRKQGHKIILVHEGDLWDALRDAEVA